MDDSLLASYRTIGLVQSAIAIGAVGSALLAFAMSAASLRRITKFNLTDINKA